MALFKLRKKVDEPMAAAAPAESIEAMRRRAKHRLIGAVVLVLAGVIGFPVLFDTQPRPVAVDIPIEIPDRNKVKPLPPAAPVATGKVTSAPVVEAPRVAAVEPTPAKVESEARPQPAPQPAPQRGEGEKSAKPEGDKLARAEGDKPPKAEADKAAKAEADKAAKAEADKPAKPEPEKIAKADDSAKARALLDGQSLEAGGARFVVQVGAFAESDKARQAQQKLERAGLRNYTHVADTEGGKRIRVRAGPFASRAEADKAAEKIKGLDLPARVLTL